MDPGIRERKGDKGMYKREELPVKLLSIYSCAIGNDVRDIELRQG